MAVVGVIMGAAHTYVSQLEPTRMSFAVPAPHREVSHWHRMVKHAKVGRYLFENVLFYFIEILVVVWILNSETAQLSPSWCGIWQYRCRQNNLSE